MFGPPQKTLATKKPSSLAKKIISNLLEIFHFKLLRSIKVPLADRAPPSLDSLALQSLETKVRTHVGVLWEKEVGLGGVVG